jgi:hypothetical protein
MSIHEPGASQRKEHETRGAMSFCIPRAAVEALLDAGATGYEICAYLVLARFTDESGVYSTASITAVNKYTGANKTKGGTIDRALNRLEKIHARHKTLVPSGLKGHGTEMVERSVDLGPILYNRESWSFIKDEILPDGPHERSKILFVLPDFNEPKEERIWIGANLVGGVGEFKLPMKELKNAGDVAARLLLMMYATNDMEVWGGVRPVGPDSGPWKHYEPVSADIALKGGSRLVRSKDAGSVARIKEAVLGGTERDAYWSALSALLSAGFVYEVVMVLNRSAKPAKLHMSEAPYGAIPDDAEPYCELGARNMHGYKPDGEEGVGGETAKLAGELAHSVTLAGGKFDGTYAAFVRDGFPAMIAGIYRLRFRVANPANLGVKSAWARIHQNNRDALELLERVRAANGLAASTPSAQTAKRRPANWGFALPV